MITSFLGFLQLLLQLTQTRNLITHTCEPGVEGLKVKLQVQGRSNRQSSCACSTNHQSIGLQCISCFPPCSTNGVRTNTHHAHWPISLLCLFHTLRWAGSSVGTASDRHTADTGLIPSCGKGFFSKSQFSVQTLMVSYTPVCNHTHLHLCAC